MDSVEGRGLERHGILGGRQISVRKLKRAIRRRIRRAIALPDPLRRMTPLSSIPERLQGGFHLPETQALRAPSVGTLTKAVDGIDQWRVPLSRVRRASCACCKPIQPVHGA
ncbi:hypothetical protein RR42_m4082 [Cupriavidus basilensis]|uniref:Uncharacterized protein n=1 Tax=Cupriavidus basilensis TaxID=68895 RepID=A0A0C4YF92_9BURK|nr:hypothetical protein RR42_m4082 [Cupriavidus basilensis]